MNFDLNKNFWKEYPDLLIIPEIEEFYTKDTTKGKSYSSKIMWGVLLISNPNSTFYNAPNKKDLIAKSVYKDEAFNWEKITAIIDAYTSCALTAAERSLHSWNETMTLRDSSLKFLYTKALEGGDIDELVKLDKMLSTTAKMFDDYQRVLETFNNEKLKSNKAKNVNIADSDEL